MPLAVGVDAANVLRDRRGIGRYVRSLLRVWRQTFANRIEPMLLVPDLLLPLVASRLAADTGVDRMQVARRQSASQLGLNLVWYPWNGMTWSPPVPCVVTLHDVWPFVSPARDARRRAREQKHYLKAVKHATRFIAVSNYTAREAATYLDIDPQRIDVVPHGVDFLSGAGVAPARFDGVDRYVLFVGEVEPRKDVATLLDAMGRLPLALRRSTALVVAGRNGARPRLARRGLRVEALGEVSDERLGSLYAGAAAFAFPSRHEGFGLPVLEAMRYGAPVVASSAGAIPEAGGDAALYFPPGDAQALADALARVLQDAGVARSLSEAGRARAAQMTQIECARRSLEVFERVADD